MKRLASIILLASLTASAAFAKDKIDRQQWLDSKRPEAADLCHQNIIDTAKDPESVQFSNRYSYDFGSGFSRNTIFIVWEIMGKNSYGAVLRHKMTCSVSCPPDKSCHVVDLDDQP